MMRPTVFGVALAVLAGSYAAATPGCGAVPFHPSPVFAEPRLVDPVRAGGEPSIQPLADGSLLYSAHAGTTHLHLKGGATTPQDPSDFVLGYDGTVNTWLSRDMGATWQRVPLLEQATGAPLPQGFSDPSTAVDAAGNVYLAAIDAVTVYVGRSANGERFVGNKLAAFNMDREWLAADLDGVVYLRANPFGAWPTANGGIDNVLWRSTDGGASWEDPRGVSMRGYGHSPLLVNPTDGALVWPESHAGMPYAANTRVHVYPFARSGDLTTTVTAYVEDGLPTYGGFITPSAADDAGNLYIVSNRSDRVQVASSTDGGRTWRTQVVARSAGEIVWPWIAAGSDGRVAVAWLERTSDTQDWRVEVATSVTAHGWTDGCGQQRAGVWRVDHLTRGPMHRGYICDGGLGCNPSLSPRADRRLGDYFTIAITPAGSLVAAFGETVTDPGSAISHPAFVAQVGGVDFRP